MLRDTLHDRLVSLACKDGGWQTGRWKPSFLAKCKENDLWAGEIDGEDNGDGIWGGIRFNPDAWRIVVEDENTPGDKWNYPVLIVEFLEVEISHPMPLEKRRLYNALWWRFDGTSCFHMRVYRAERYGGVKLWLDIDTAHEEILL